MYRFKNSEEYLKQWYFFDDTFPPEVLEIPKERESHKCECKCEGSRCPYRYECPGTNKCDSYKKNASCPCQSDFGYYFGSENNEIDRKRNGFAFPISGQVRYFNGVKYIWKGPEYQGDDGHWERTDGKDIDEWTFAPGR